MTDTYISPTKRHLPKVLQTLSIIFGSVLALYALYRLLGFVGEIERLANMFMHPEYVLPIDVTLEIINFVSAIAFVFSVSVLSVSLLTSKKTIAKISFIGNTVNYTLLCVCYLMRLIYQIGDIFSYSYLDSYFPYLFQSFLAYLIYLTIDTLTVIAFIIAIRKVNSSDTHNNTRHQWKAPVILLAIANIINLIMFISREIETAASNATVIYIYNHFEYIINTTFGYIVVGIVCFAIYVHTLPYGKNKTPKPVFAEETSPEPVYTPTVEEIPAPQYTPAPEIPAPAPVDLVTPKTNAKFVSGELVEYKKLLDMGIITQEEFDAKKKQLLGL